MKGRTVIKTVCKTDGQHFKSNKAETKLVHQNKFFSGANYGDSEIEGNPVCNVIIIKGMALTVGYELPMKSFQLLGVSRLYVVPCSCGILHCGTNWTEG